MVNFITFFYWKSENKHDYGMAQDAQYQLGNDNNMHDYYRGMHYYPLIFASH